MSYYFLSNQHWLAYFSIQFHHRDPGLVGLLSSDKIPKDQTVYFGIISDGVHTHPSALRIAYRVHRDGLILVTDAISALGLEEGIHYIGQLAIKVFNKMAFIDSTDTLCGSIAPMDECIRIFKKATGFYWSLWSCSVGQMNQNRHIYLFQTAQLYTH